MYRFSRFFNEISALLSREYLSTQKKFQLFFAFYGLRRYRASSHSVRFMGLEFYTPSYSNFVGIIREVFIFGDYYFKSDSPNPVIIDCGANIGVTTIFLKWLYPDARITAFEPSPVAVAALRKNIALNKLQNVEVIEAAATGDVGSITFWEQTAKPGGSTAMRDVFDSKSKTAKFDEVTVRGVRLSAYITGDVDLLKMDVEGAEGVIVQELARSGSLVRIKNIIMEFHENADNAQNDLSTMVTTLKQAGFRIVVFASEVTPSSEMMAKKHAHHFLIRAFR